MAQIEVKNKVIFKENQMDLVQPHFETHRAMMVQLGMISKEVLTPMKGDNFIFPVAEEQSKPLQEINVWDRPPQSGIVQNEERNKKFFEEN